MSQASTGNVDGPASAHARQIMDILRAGADDEQDAALSVGVVRDGGTAVVGCEAALETGPQGRTAITEPIRIPALSPVLVSALLRSAVHYGLFRWTDRLEQLVRLPPWAAPDELREATLRQLIDQSHGLDDSILRAASAFQHQGRNAGVAPSSTESAGLQLAAAILERHHQAAYAEMLQERLFRPLGIVSGFDQEPARSGTCPSGNLKISIPGLLRWLAAHFDPAQSSDAAGSSIYLDPGGWKTATVISPDREAGWTGRSLGWRSFDRGWYCNETCDSDSGTAMAFHPEGRTGFVIHRLTATPGGCEEPCIVRVLRAHAGAEDRSSANEDDPLFGPGGVLDGLDLDLEALLGRC